MRLSAAANAKLISGVCWRVVLPGEEVRGGLRAGPGFWGVRGERGWEGEGDRAPGGQG